MSAPLRLLVVPEPGRVHRDPWAALIETAAATPGVEVAVIGTGAVALPPGVLAHELRPEPLPAPGHPYLAWPTAAVATGRAAARSLGGLLAARFRPDVVVADAASGVALFLAEVVAGVPLVVRVPAYRVPPFAVDVPPQEADGVLSTRTGLVVTDFALVGAHAIVCPDAAVRAALPSMFGPSAAVVADGVDLTVFRPADATEHAAALAAPPVVALLGAASPDADRVRVAYARLRRTVPDLRLAAELDLLPAPDRARVLATATVCTAIGDTGPALDEALACGAVVVAGGDARGWAAIRHGESGYLTDGGSVDALTAALGYAVTYRDRLGAVRAGARADAAARADRVVTAHRYLALAAEAAGGRLPGPRLRSEELPPRG